MLVTTCIYAMDCGWAGADLGIMNGSRRVTDKNESTASVEMPKPHNIKLLIA